MSGEFEMKTRIDGVNIFIPFIPDRLQVEHFLSQEIPKNNKRTFLILQIENKPEKYTGCSLEY